MTNRVRQTFLFVEYLNVSFSKFCILLTSTDFYKKCSYFCFFGIEVHVQNMYSFFLENIVDVRIQRNFPNIFFFVNCYGMCMSPSSHELCLVDIVYVYKNEVYALLFRYVENSIETIVLCKCVMFPERIRSFFTRKRPWYQLCNKTVLFQWVFTIRRYVWIWNVICQTYYTHVLLVNTHTTQRDERYTHSKDWNRTN